MYTAQALKKLLSSIDNGEFTYQKKKKEHIDWTVYDCAQIHEISNMLKKIRDAVDHACIELDSDSRPRSRGRPPVHPGDVTQGFIQLFKEKLGITSEFSYKTIGRGYERKDVREILERIHELTQVPILDEEHDFSIDGTGLSTSIKQNHENNYESISSDSVISSISNHTCSDPKIH
jgi:hypothetical protein